MKNVVSSIRGRSQGVPKIFSALRGHLCHSIAFLLLIAVAISYDISYVRPKFGFGGMRVSTPSPVHLNRLFFRWGIEILRAENTRFQR